MGVENLSAWRWKFKTSRWLSISFSLTVHLLKQHWHTTLKLLLQQDIQLNVWPQLQTICYHSELQGIVFWKLCRVKSGCVLSWVNLTVRMMCGILYLHYRNTEVSINKGCVSSRFHRAQLKREKSCSVLPKLTYSLSQSKLNWQDIVF